MSILNAGFKEGRMQRLWKCDWKTQIMNKND